MGTLHPRSKCRHILFFFCAEQAEIMAFLIKWLKCCWKARTLCLELCARYSNVAPPATGTYATRICARAENCGYARTFPRSLGGYWCSYPQLFSRSNIDRVIDTLHAGQRRSITESCLIIASIAKVPKINCQIFGDSAIPASCASIPAVKHCTLAQHVLGHKVQC